MDGQGYSVEIADGYDEAVIRTRLALKSEGFSILSEMNVAGLLPTGAGDARQYLFLGVWNGALVESRLDSELQMAVHLPCNFVVHEGVTGSMVAALDPSDTVDPTEPTHQLAAEDARAAITKVLSRVAEEL